MPKARPVLRRSTRDRHAVYSSLMENCIGLPGGSDMFESLLEESRRRHDQEKLEDMRESRYPSRNRSSRRNLRSFQNCDDDAADNDSNNENVLIPPPQNDDEPENSARNTSRHRTAKKMQLTPLKEEDPELIEEEEDITLYERVKRRRLVHDEVLPKRRHADSVKSIDASEDGEEDDANEGQRYYFRRNRAQVNRLQDESARQTGRKRKGGSRHGHGRSIRHRRSIRHLEYRPSRRPSTSTSSISTSSASDSDVAATQKDLNAEARFERRKLKSLAKGRSRFLPVNMSNAEFAHAQNLNHLTSQLTAGDLNGVGDIEPMTVDKSTTFTEIGGLESHVQSLKEVVAFPLLYPDLFSTFGINAPKGVLFYGPPGTGKTLMARALANECSKDGRKVAFFMRKGADCLSKWVGESERQLRLLFDQAYQMRPSIIFFDEIDGLAPVRSTRQDQIHSSIVSTLLALMDGLDSRGQVVVIGATNRLDSLDPALRRPGRFDRELRFDLPDVASREAILNIHTSAWNEMKPSAEELTSLAGKTSGYCGADLKALCAEAVLVAVRMRFPHIYMSDDKLELDTSTLKVKKWHFTEALRRIVPASRRDLTTSSFATDHRLDVLITPVVSSIIKNLPNGYVCRKPQNAGSELQSIVESLKIPPSVPSTRILLHADGNVGQSRYFINSLISKLDHLPVFTLSMGKLFANSQPEENLSAVILDITRAIARGVPALLTIPDIDLLQKSLNASLWHMLVSSLQSFDGFTPLLVLASVKTAYIKCSAEIKSIFPKRNAVEITAPSEEERLQFFKQITAEAFDEPAIFDAEKYPTPPKAKIQNAGRRMSEAEIKKLEESYEQMLRQFRIFLRDMLGRLVRDRRFTAFNLPVDREKAADYYEIITHPMSLSEMMQKIDEKEYSTKGEFLSDIALIRANALEYNPADKMESKVIRHSAGGLMDMAEALFDTEMDDDFELNMRKTAKLISEMKAAPTAAPAEEPTEESPPVVASQLSTNLRSDSKNKLQIDEHQLNAFTDKAAKHTANWDIFQIESLGVRCVMKIQEFADLWDRQMLPHILNTELDNFLKN